MNLIIISFIYLIGCRTSYLMIKIDHLSEKQPYTRLDKILNILLSIGSFITCITILVTTWFKKIHVTGYWGEEVNKPIVNPKTNAS